MGTLLKFFPTLSPDILREEQFMFEQKMSYINMLLADQSKYRAMFPYIPEALLKTYYFEMLDKLDMHRVNSRTPFAHLKTIPKKVLIKIFQYTDFFDLVRFSCTNSVLYNHINNHLLFKSRFSWEREHSQYISFCIFQGRYQDLAYTCSNPIEENYKNQIILKRNLARINPPDNHPFHDFSSFSVFKHQFKKIYGNHFKFTESVVYNNLVVRCFDLLRDSDRRKYEHAAAIAKRYGFIFCFRTVNWTVAKDVIPIKWCQETAVIDYIDEVTSKRRSTIKPRTKDYNEPLEINQLGADDDLTIVVDTK